jgi:hypothetical protein
MATAPRGSLRPDASRQYSTAEAFWQRNRAAASGGGAAIAGASSWYGTGRKRWRRDIILAFSSSEVIAEVFWRA